MAKIKEEGLEDKLEVTALAGFSLGEYSALTAAGAIDDIAKGIDIVTKRGTLMQEAGWMKKETTEEAWLPVWEIVRLFWKLLRKPERTAYLKPSTSIRHLRQ